jgi:hypothetical protein
MITVTAASGSLTHSVSSTMYVYDFSVSASPTSVVVPIGSSTTVTFVLAGDAQFSPAQIYMYTTGCPTGVTCSFQSYPILGPGQSINDPLTITVGTGAVAGNYVVTGIGQSGTLSHSVNIALTITSDFSVSASPTSVSESAATSANSTITLTSLYGFSGAIALTIALPSNATVSGVTSLYWQWYAPGSCNVKNCNITQTVSANGVAKPIFSIWSYSNTAVGNYVVTVTGSSGSLTHSVTVTVKVSLYVSSGGGGGGSLAKGTLITMADGSQVPVQNIRIGDKMMGYDTSTCQYTISTVTSIKIVETTTLLVIHTANGAPLRTDASPTEILWTRLQNGTALWLPVTQLRSGDALWTQNGWDPVLDITYVSTGLHSMYDITATIPYFANGYLDPPHPS